MKRIFLAEDDEDDTELLMEAILNLIPADFVCSINGYELLEKLKDETPPIPDILFLDLNMPMKTGYDCLKIIKANPKYKNIQVVIFTTSKDLFDIKRTYDAGADYFISKPSSLKGYEAVLKKLFEFNPDIKTLKEQFVIN